MTNKINSLISQIQAAGINKITPTASTTNGNSPLSFGIVNSKSNGKRVSLSKALVKAIGISATVDIIVQINAGVIHLCADFSDIDGYSRYSLRGDDRKICYSYELVNFLTQAFGLNFSNHVSMSFRNISFTTHNGLSVATITLDENAAKLFETSLAITENETVLHDSYEHTDEDAPPKDEDDNFVFDEYEDEISDDGIEDALITNDEEEA